MNFEERTNAIGTLLRDVILPRYKRPEHLSDEAARAEAADMVADLNSEWPIMGQTRFAEVSGGLAKALRLTHTSRTWPTVAALCKALKVACAPPSNPSADDDARKAEALYGMVLDWWRQHKGPLPSVAREEHAQRLVSEGHATWGQLRRAGFDLPEHGRKAAKEEPDPNHRAILDSIRAMGERVRSSGFTGKGSLGIEVKP